MTTAIPSMMLIMVIMVLIISVGFFGNAAVNGSHNTSDRSESLQQAAAIHQSFRANFFTIIVPNGWAIDEVAGTHTDALLSEIIH